MRGLWRFIGPGRSVPNFQWSWETDPNAMGEFGRGIVASDDAFRRGTVLLGFVLANHLVSAIDAHVTRRLSSETRTGPVSYWF